MFFYARADTHFLLYIYDNVRNELIDRSKPGSPEENRLELVLQKSKETSLLRYESQVYDTERGRGPGGWYQTLVKAPTLLSNEQFAVFRAVHAWRDNIARQDDDSTNFVMPNHVLLSLSKLMPADMASMYGAIHPISHNVKARAGELLQLIKSSRETGKDGPSMMDVLRPDSVGAVTSANIRYSKVAAAEKQAVALTTLSAALDGDLRSEKSTFWGGAFGSSTWDEPSTLTHTGADIRLAIPLPQLAAEAFSEGISVGSKVQEEPQPEPEQDYTPIVEEQPFTIKSGKKRKSEEIEADQGTPSGEYDISLNEEEEQAAREKAALKAKRRAEKKAEKLAKRIANGEIPENAGMEAEEEEPFDYSKAESVLNKKRTNDQGGNKRQKKPFDPYQKSTDAPKGMRRLQTERPGKSFTFKG